MIRVGSTSTGGARMMVTRLFVSLLLLSLCSNKKISSHFAQAQDLFDSYTAWYTVEIRLDGREYIRSTDLCWDIPGGVNTPGAVLQLYPCHGGPSQIFVAKAQQLHSSSSSGDTHTLRIQIKHKSSGLCVVVDNNGKLQTARCCVNIFDPNEPPETGICSHDYQDFVLNDASPSPAPFGTKVYAALTPYATIPNDIFSFHTSSPSCVTVDDSKQHEKIGLYTCRPRGPVRSRQRFELDLCRTFHPYAVDWDFCQSWCPCNANEGDCDNDSQCVAGTECKQVSGVDYCRTTTPPPPTPPSSTPCNGICCGGIILGDGECDGQCISIGEECP